MIFYDSINIYNLCTLACMVFPQNKFIRIRINNRILSRDDKLMQLFYFFYKYSRTPLIRPPSESHWCGRIRGMVAREGFIYEQKPLSVTRYVVV